MRTDDKKMMDYCTYCPKMCRFSCPVSEVTKNESHTPWGKMQLGGLLTDKKMVLGTEHTLPLYQCTSCLRCQIYCEHDNDVPEALRAVREMAVANYAAPPGVFAVGEQFSKANNPYGKDLWASNPPSRALLEKKTRVRALFFPSCHTLNFFPERLAVYQELFEKLGVKDLTVRPSPLACCGEPLRVLGFRKEFSEIAEVHYFSLKEYDLLVTDDAECCHSFRDHYPKEGLKFPLPILHLLEYLEPYLKNVNYRTHGKIKSRFVFHGSSFLSRHLGLVGLPRELLAHVTGFTPLNMSQWGKDTLGSSCEGAYQWVFPEIAEKIGKQIIAELEGRRIKTLVTASAPAEAMWKRLAKNTQIIDIFEFINQQIVSESSS